MWSKWLYGIALMLIGGVTCAASYPVRPIRLVVPYPPGGGADFIGRMIAEGLSVKFGQPVVVDNRAGANTIIGTDVVARSAPDGYTLLLTTASFGIVPGLYKLPFDPVKNFSPVIYIASVSLVLVTSPSMLINSVKDLIAKSKPGELTFASFGNGSTSQLAGELFKQMTGVNMVHVPFKGSAPALTDVVAGRVSVMFSSMEPAMPFVTSGRLKAVAVTNPKRIRALPDIPTVAESGLAGFAVTGWNGVSAPGGTARDLMDVLNKAIAEVMTQPEFQKKISLQGYELVGGSPAEFSAFIQTEIDRWGKVIKGANVKEE